MCPRYNDKCVKVIKEKEQKYWSLEIASLTLRASGSTFLRTSTKVAVPQTGMLNLVNMSTIALKNWTSTGTITTIPPTASATSITGATPPPAYLQGPWHWHFQLSFSRISDDLNIAGGL